MKKIYKRDLNKVKDDLLARLGKGEANARLAKELNIKPRLIRLAVKELRKEGYPICSGNNGYWIAKDILELRATIIRLDSQRADIEKTINSLLENLKGGA